jgi:hypothetical protein
MEAFPDAATSRLLVLPSRRDRSTPCLKHPRPRRLAGKQDRPLSLRHKQTTPTAHSRGVSEPGGTTYSIALGMGIASLANVLLDPLPSAVRAGARRDKRLGCGILGRNRPAPRSALLG